ncbi:hypothetical protein Hanom_Chr12g01117501 [Helianthus anomalus]
MVVGVPIFDVGVPIFDVGVPIYDLVGDGGSNNGLFGWWRVGGSAAVSGGVPVLSRRVYALVDFGGYGFSWFKTGGGGSTAGWWTGGSAAVSGGGPGLLPTTSLACFVDFSVDFGDFDQWSFVGLHVFLFILMPF